ncbi:MAG: hypothetical protein ACD_10C00862G0003, partial [uncultured bacterium]
MSFGFNAALHHGRDYRSDRSNVKKFFVHCTNRFVLPLNQLLECFEKPLLARLFAYAVGLMRYSCAGGWLRP